jgi:hypothetical protein
VSAWASAIQVVTTAGSAPLPSAARSPRMPRTKSAVSGGQDHEGLSVEPHGPVDHFAGDALQRFIGGIADAPHGLQRVGPVAGQLLGNDFNGLPDLVVLRLVRHMSANVRAPTVVSLGHGLNRVTRSSTSIASFGSPRPMPTIRIWAGLLKSSRGARGQNPKAERPDLVPGQSGGVPESRVGVNAEAVR